jgi:glutathione-regulated potassium-efflux system ancillary protein KefG
MAAPVLLVVAHPAFERARVTPALAHAGAAAPGVELHDLYEAYPDFLIDVEAEQQRLLDHDIVALQFPFFWYSVPALLKEWIDLVFTHGFAYGRGGTRLAGKTLLCGLSTGGSAEAYGPGGGNRFTIEEFLRPLEATAHLCGMRWAPPFVVHGAAVLTPEGLASAAEGWAARLAALASDERATA